MMALAKLWDSALNSWNCIRADRSAESNHADSIIRKVSAWVCSALNSQWQERSGLRTAEADNCH